MALTAEETRALNYNLSRIRRADACRVRVFQLRGNDAAAQGLRDRTEAVLTEISNEQRQKIRYDGGRDFVCEGDAINGDHGG
jgi:hypothetical protein